MSVAILLLALATVWAALAVVYWAWIDRPRYAWGVPYEWRTSEQGKKTETVTVQALGTAVAHSVEVRVTGAEPEERQQMSAYSQPIVLDAKRPDEGAKDFYLVIFWRERRPLRRRREYGERIELRSHRYERWQWKRWRTQKQLNRLPAHRRGTWREKPRKPIATIPRRP